MSVLAFGMLLLGVLVGLSCWLAYHLVLQHGRLLLRVEALEEQLAARPAEAAPEPRGKVDKGLAASRLNRNGLATGTPAPDFVLPRLDGGHLTLAEYRGRRVLLVFSDPHCSPCQQITLELERLHREQSDLRVLIVSRRDPETNREKIARPGMSVPIVLQDAWEISRLYGMFATPAAYLIDERGVIAAPVAMGVAQVRELMRAAAGSTVSEETDFVHHRQGALDGKPF